MTDANSLELYESTKTTEGSQTQAQIIQDLFEGKGLRTETAQSQLEGYYRRFLVEHSGRAYQELTGVVGLDPDKLSLVRDAGSISLESEEKKKLMDYLLERNHGWIQKPSESDLFGDEESATKHANEMLSLANLYHSVNPKEYEIEIIGPVIRITFKDADVYGRFTDSMNIGGTLGLFFPMPLRSSDENGEWTSSSNTFINLISPGEEYSEEDSVHQHEIYHAVDYFRLEQLRKIAETNPDDPSIKGNVLLTEGDKFKERLKVFFFNPTKFMQSLEALRNHAPELYDYYCGLGVTIRTFSNEATFPQEEEAFIASFLSVQREVPAFIAGFLNPKNESPFTDSQRDEVIRKLVMLYMLFRKVKLEDLRDRSAMNEQGRLMVDTEKVEEDLRKPEGKQNDPEEQLQRLIQLTKKLDDSTENRDQIFDEMSKIYPSENEKQGIDLRNHYADDRGLYTRDLQRLIDYFLNEGGKGYEIIEQIKGNLTDAMNTYRQLAALRDNPYQALVEISLIPLSHWATYTSRQRELLSRNPKQIKK